MSVSSTTAKVQYTGNGSASVFAYTFKIFDEDHIKVTKVTISTGAEEVLEITTDYTVDGVGEENGGNVTLVAGALSALYKLVIERVPPLTQGLDLAENDNLPAEEVEKAFDKDTHVAQYLKNLLDRAVLQPVTSTTPLAMPTPSTGKTLKWTAGGALENSTYDPDEVVEEAQTAQAAAEAAQAAAEAAQTAAETAETNAETAETNAETAEQNAENYATKTDGFAAGSDNSSKSWAVGGTGDGQPTAGPAKDWAEKTSGTVDGSGYSAKEHARGTQTRGQAGGGSAKDWANYTGGTVDNTEYSAKKYAQDAAASAAEAAASGLTELKYNVAVLGFQLAVANSLTQFNLVDGIVDEFTDESGVDTGASSNEDYDADDDLYTPTRDESDGGTGADGAITTAGNEDFNGSKWKGYAYKIASIASAVITCTNDPVNIAAGDKILVMHLQGDAGDTTPSNCAHVGKWEIATVLSVDHGAKTITCTGNITNSSLDTGGKAFVQRVPQFTNVTVSSGHTVTPQTWAGTDGNIGVIAFMATGTVSIAGTLSAAGKGFAGGAGSAGSNTGGSGGESWGGAGGAGSGGTGSDGKGGGGAGHSGAGGAGRTGGGGGGTSYGSSNNGGAGGGGGEHGGAGGAGYGVAGSDGALGSNFYNGKGGGTFGGATLQSGALTAGAGMSLGPGGGGGGWRGAAGGAGGAGGGIIWIQCDTLTVTGSITANGANGSGSGSNSGGGGGAGGAIRLKAKTATLGSALITAAGGSGGDGFSTTHDGGAGGAGRIAVRYGSGGVTGTTSPTYNSTSEAWTDALIHNMTLVSDGFTAESQPDTARVVIREEDVDSATLNTDLTVEVSRDGGTTWEAGTLVDEGDYSTGVRILAADGIDLSGQPAGTTMKYRIKSLNNKDLKIHGVALAWDA